MQYKNMQYKKEVFSLLDVQPDEVYFLPRTITPVKVICAATHGWQRGFVRLDLKIDRCPEYAYAYLCTDHANRIKLKIERNGWKFYFVDCRIPTLLQARSVDFSKLKNQILSEIEDNNKSIEKLQEEVKRQEQRLGLINSYY